MAVECDAEGCEVLLLNTPARRLALFSPCNSATTLAEASMSLLQRFDAWGKHAYRNAMGTRYNLMYTYMRFFISIAIFSPCNSAATLAEASMSLLQRFDAWGKNAYRNAMGAQSTYIYAYMHIDR